ncbi:hypothetical protein ACFV7Q_28980 [Streptomyces sp. NPDC059851]|uniref:hypothetical protein n=1 Tax=Streptomyces sp. NPDC059851 TaxID=3346971 RepID=UPI0036554A19
MIELLPGAGVLLPNGVGTLRFGMDAEGTQELLASLGAVEEEKASSVAPGGWWGRSLRWCDVELTARAEASAPAPGSGPLTGSVPGPDPGPAAGPPLAEVALRRGGFRPSWRGPAAVPVVLDGIDLFGYPADEVLEALGENRYPGLRLPSAGPDGYLPAVVLRSVPPPGDGDRGRSGTDGAGPDLAAYADMWTTRRHEWQLEDTGSGYTIVTKGERPMELLICHDELAEQVVARMIAAGVDIVDG